MTDTEHPAAWHPDPARRHEQRYWDGEQWTAHVSDSGTTSEDTDGQQMANTGQSASSGIIDGEVFGYSTPGSIQAQVAKAQTGSTGIFDAMSMPDVPSTEVPAPDYERSIFTENIIVVNQKAKIFELTSEFGVFDQNGNQIGSVRQVGQSAAKKAARMLTGLDALMTHTLDIVDMNGNLLLRITKPRSLGFVPKVIVQNAQGQTLGELVTKFRIGKAQIKLMVGNSQLGMIYAENFRAWDFKVLDAQENRIASITKTWEGFAKAMFTTADNYVIQIHEELQDPLKSMVLASSLAVDLMLKQNDKGLLGGIG